MVPSKDLLLALSKFATLVEKRVSEKPNSKKRSRCQKRRNAGLRYESPRNSGRSIIPLNKPTRVIKEVPDRATVVDGYALNDKSQFQCKFIGCCRRFTRKGDFKRHEATHVPGKWVCKICPKRLTRKGKLKEHMLKQHKNKLSSKSAEEYLATLDWQIKRPERAIVPLGTNTENPGKPLQSKDAAYEKKLFSRRKPRKKPRRHLVPDEDSNADSDSSKDSRNVYSSEDSSEDDFSDYSDSESGDGGTGAGALGQGRMGGDSGTSTFSSNSELEFGRPSSDGHSYPFLGFNWCQAMWILAVSEAKTLVCTTQAPSLRSWHVSSPAAFWVPLMNVSECPRLINLSRELIRAKSIVQSRKGAFESSTEDPRTGEYTRDRFDKGGYQSCEYENSEYGTDPPPYLNQLAQTLHSQPYRAAVVQPLIIPPEKQKWTVQTWQKNPKGYVRPYPNVH
jgi:hypothetical protein